MVEDNEAMPNSPLSLEVEQVRCTLRDVLCSAGQQPYKKSMVTLSNSQGKEYYGMHRDRFLQLPARVMIGNGISRALMITILSNPKRISSSSRKTHRVKKFWVPEYIVELLEELPFMVGFHIRGDVLTNEDTFSLMVGQDLKLSSFVELGSLCLYAGWAYPTCNMPAMHGIVTGSILIKLVSQADDQLWEAMRVYAIADLHCWLIWNILVGCLLWIIFPDPGELAGGCPP